MRNYIYGFATASMLLIGYAYATAIETHWDHAQDEVVQTASCIERWRNGDSSDWDLWARECSMWHKPGGIHDVAASK